jgi:hypothetical protein
VVGAHYNDASSAGLSEGALHLDNDGRCGQFTRYYLRAPDGPDTRIQVTAEVQVVANAGRAATLSIPYAGALRLFPDHVEMAHDPSLRAEVSPGQFHTYQVRVDGGRLELRIDGRRALSTDRADDRTVRCDWTPIHLSPYLFAFGNEPTFLSSFELTAQRGEHSVVQWQARYEEAMAGLRELEAIPPTLMLGTGVALDQITPWVTGYSLWRRVEARLDHPDSGTREQSWVAGRDGFPDQYQLDRVLEVEASIGGGDQGYSGWTELADGRIFVVNYTDDTAPACPSTPNWPSGLTWIRGTWLEPSDVP